MKMLFEIVSQKKVVFTFGRFNPPTSGHFLLVDKVFKLSKELGAASKIYISQTQDSKKNPLSFDQKLKYLRMGMPFASSSFVSDKSIKTPYQAVFDLSDRGFTEVIMVVGDDRVNEFRKGITPYIKDTNIKKFSVVSAGARDPDADDVTGMSASKMRSFVASNDFNSFRKGVPAGLNSDQAKSMFQDIKKSMKLSESSLKIANTLNIKRKDMPQVKRENIQNYLKFLSKNGISFKKKLLPIYSLKPTQKEINLKKVVANKTKFVSGIKVPKPFLVSSDNYIIDGHHQLFAMREIPDFKDVRCYVIDLPILDLLEATYDYPRVFFSDID